MTQLAPPTPPPPPTWSRVKAILADALDQDLERREAFLDSACAGQPALRRRLAELVRAYADTPSLNDADSPARAFTSTFEPQPGAQLGRYRIVRLIGRGGMGTVYEAFDDQLGRPVAVKLMQAGIASRSMLKRFDLESRLLARLRHPGIAQIFEAGTVSIPGTLEHAPFFAMELVSGATPITAFAEGAKLSFEDRIRLFLSVCDAVCHGHQRGVIHRDLKPANILVDASGQVKIIDFGVARTEDPGAAATTIAGELLGTIRYMSPEQVAGCEGDAEDLDFRTDVYSLGVVLYELLTGHAPHADPTGGVLASIREAMHRTPAPLSRLAPTLTGDIQTVALKAVQPDRHVRYQSVAEFAADLGRILRHEPISARSLSAVYQIRLFARRHRTLVSAFVLVFLALVLGFIGTTIGLVRARDAEHLAHAQTRRAQRIAAFLKNTLRSADPQVLPPQSLAAMDPKVNVYERWASPSADWGSAGPSEVGVAGVLRHAAEHLGTEFHDDPALQAELTMLLAQTLIGLEDAQFAVGLLESALRIFEHLKPPDEEAVLRCRILYGQTLGLQRLEECEYQFRLAEESATRLFGPFDSRTLYISGRHASAIGYMPGRYDEAVARVRELIDDCATRSGRDSSEAWLAHMPLIELLSLPSTPSARAELQKVGRATIDGLARTIGPDVLPIARVCQCLGTDAPRDRDTAEDAQMFLRRSLDIYIKHLGTDSTSAYDTRTGLMSILLRQRKLAEAESLGREALASSLRMIGPRSQYTMKAEARLARVLTWQEKDADEAERLARHAAEGTALLWGAAEHFVSYHHAIWAAAVRQRHQPAQAETMLRERLALRGNRSPRADAAWVEGYQYLQLALCLADQNRPDEATAAIRTARAWGEELHDPLHSVYLNILEVQKRLDPSSSN